MEKVKFLISSLVLIGLLSFFYSCDEDSDSQDTPEVANTICNTTPDGCGGSFESCSNGVSTWYTYKGKRYTCASAGDCTAAATALANDLCNKTTSSKGDFEKKVQDILNTYPLNK